MLTFPHQLDAKRKNGDIFQFFSSSLLPHLHPQQLQQLQNTSNHNDHYGSSFGAGACGLTRLGHLHATDGAEHCQAVSPRVHRKPPSRHRKHGVEPGSVLPWHRPLWLSCSTREADSERQDCDFFMVLKPRVCCPRHPEPWIRVPISPRYE